MNKILVSILMSIIALLISIGVTIATNWINGLNSDRKTDENAIRELQLRSQYLNGPVPAAPITTIIPKK